MENLKNGKVALPSIIKYPISLPITIAFPNFKKERSRLKFLLEILSWLLDSPKYVSYFKVKFKINKPHCFNIKNKDAKFSVLCAMFQETISKIWLFKMPNLAPKTRICSDDSVSKIIELLCMQGLGWQHLDICSSPIHLSSILFWTRNSKNKIALSNFILMMRFHSHLSAILN